MTSENDHDISISSAVTSSSRGRQYTPWALSCLVLVGAALIGSDLSSRSLWIDEIATVAMFARQPVGQIVRQFHANNHVLHSILVHLSVTVLGEHELAVRLPAAWMGILGLAAAYPLGKRLFGWRVGLVGTFLLLLSPGFMYHARHARGYSGLMFFSMISVILLEEARKSGGRRTWAAYIAAIVLCVYTHLAGLLVLATEAVYLLILGALDAIRKGGAKGAAKAAIVSLWRGPALSLAVVLVIYAPMLRTAYDFAGANAIAGNLDLDLGGISRTLTDFSPIGKSVVARALGLLLVLVGGAYWWQKRREQVILAGVWMVVPFGVLYLAQLVLPSLYVYDRFVVFILPVYAMMVSAGIVALGEVLGRRAGLPSGSTSRRSYAVVAVLVAVGLFCFAYSASLRAGTTEDWQGVALYLSKRISPGDIVLCDGVLYGKGGDSTRAQRALRYYMESIHPDDLIVRETEIARKLRSRGDDRGKVWAVVFRAQEELRPIWREDVRVVDFPMVTIVQVEQRNPMLRDSAIAALEALIDIIANPEATEDLYAALWAVRRPYAEALLDDGDGHMEAGDPETAIRLYREAIELDPTLARAHLRLGDALKSGGLCEDALRAYSSALELNSALGNQEWFRSRSEYCRREVALGRVDKGDALLEGADLEGAITEFEMAVEIYPTLAGAHLRLGDARRRLGQLEVAIASYQEALELQPEWNDQVWFRMRLGNAYLEAGQHERALEEFTRVLELDPEHGLAKERLEELSP